jgi:cation diffusion facilitator CzcD-associated flavoprotein CzcO
VHVNRAHSDVLIIGAGPAGIALGYHLQQLAVDFRIVEQGPTPGESWRRMPANLKLVSPWKSTRLPGSPGPWPSNYPVPRAEFLQYLRDYAAQHRLPITPGAEITTVERAADLWRVRAPGVEFTCRLLVNATGYFCNPFMPVVPGMNETRIQHIHVAEYRDPARVAELIRKASGEILIVGKRLSAGQTMLELHDAGFNVALSHRAPIEFGAGELGWWFFFRIFPYLEWLRLKCRGQAATATRVRMPGGRIRKLITSGRVKCFAELTAFDADHAVFANAHRARFDLVIFATGFRPALRHLEALSLERNPESGLPALNELESVSAPGLFFIGLDQSRNFQSRFIRGIRNDAAFLAQRLHQRLRAGHPARVATTAAGECP